MKKHALPALILLIAFTPWLSGQLSAAGGKKYFLGEGSDLLAQLPPPPADDSPAGMADLETLLQVQKDRTPGQVARAKRIDKHSAMQMGSVAFGPGFTAENFPRVAAILEELRKARREVGNGKNIWDRPRPFKRSKDIVICVKRPKNSSYPSGHSATGAFFGTIFSAAFPEYAPLFEAEIRETMWGRVLGGVHYPSDTTAGRKLGMLIATEMLKAPDTQAAVAEIRAEISAHLKAHPNVKARADQRVAEATQKN